MLDTSPKRILLSGVFGPFGVDDDFGRRENVMELFHNQVTKAQGIASFRHQHRSFGLYFLAENIDAETTVLDFPSKDRFERELREERYDIVGISFIAPNFVKAREMARLVRLHQPDAEIVLGGHGAAIEEIDRLIDCDHVVKGEGIRWLRQHLGQDPCAPIEHPALPSAERAAIMGVTLPNKAASLLVPGVGCVNGCGFCSTSHFFGKRYTAYLGSGQQLYDTACRIADIRGTDDFFVMDENFLKDRDRALELLGLMERDQRFFRFSIFSSAEAITAFGVDNMQRLGVEFVWIGVESASTKGNFEKNVGIDPRALISQLRDRGIVVLASGILCQEHHTQDNMQADIDFMCDLESDFVQFMLLTPLPTTGLYLSQKERGLIREDLCWEEWHGQKELSFVHPHFPGDAPERWITRAFRQDYTQNGSSMLRVVQTSFRGYTRLQGMKRDACLDARMASLEKRVRVWGCMLPAVARHAVNGKERTAALALDRLIRATLTTTVTERAKRVAVLGLAARWKLRVKLMGDAMQPATIVTRYRASQDRSLRAGRGSTGSERGEGCSPVELSVAARVPSGA
jgi:radical SAM superfamily enzyme YgiQ (UPF0313 family)